MNYTQWYAQNGKFQKHEQWLVDNLMIETIMGSHAYGCQTNKSDYDILAIVLPKPEHLAPQKYGFILGFDQLPDFKRKELKGKKARVLIGKQEVEAEWISLIEFFVQAGLKGSPNLIESLFVRKELVTVGTKMGYYLRDQRKLFLSMRTFQAFRGYAIGQMHRIRSRNPETEERRQIIDKYGMDCYIDTTEFLTETGWKLFKDIKSNVKVATVNIVTNIFEFQEPTDRIIKKGEHVLYEIENNFTKFAVTENHNILNSNCHRAISLKYQEKLSNWTLTPIKVLDKAKKSWYHIRTSFKNENNGVKLQHDFLTLIGLYLADGSIQLRKNKTKSLTIHQTKNGKKEVYYFMDEIKDKYNFKRYEINKKNTVSKKAITETVWVTHDKKIVNFIYKNFKNATFKKFPQWITKLSNKEADAIRYGMFIGDGTAKKRYNQEIYYTINRNLCDLYQILALLSGYDSNVLGPYTYQYKDETRLMYHVLVQKKTLSAPKAICFNTSGIKKTIKLKLRGGKVYKYVGNVVCFEVPNGTLVTRLDGKIAIQGNCKMAYHTLRLIDQIEQILTVGDIDLMRNKEECKLMRAGEWGDFDRFDKEFQKRMDHLDDLSRKCNLPPQPQQGSLKKLLLEILEEHYPSGEQSRVIDEYISVKEINEKFNTIINLLSK